MGPNSRLVFKYNCLNVIACHNRTIFTDAIKQTRNPARVSKSKVGSFQFHDLNRASKQTFFLLLCKKHQNQDIPGTQLECQLYVHHIGSQLSCFQISCFVLLLTNRVFNLECKEYYKNHNGKPYLIYQTFCIILFFYFSFSFSWLCLLHSASLLSPSTTFPLSLTWSGNCLGE